MGINWTTELISNYTSNGDLRYVWYITDTANCLLGVAVFIIFVCKKRTLQMVSEKVSGTAIVRFWSESSHGIAHTRKRIRYDHS